MDECGSETESGRVNRRHLRAILLLLLAYRFEANTAGLGFCTR